MMYLNIDEIDGIFKKYLLWGTQKFSFARFRRNDHFGNKKIPLNNDLKNFIDTSDMILANRLSSELKKYKKKVFTRDIFQTDL